MTRAECVAMVTDLLFEANASVQSALFTSTEINRVVDHANQKVWRDCVAANASFWTKRSASLTFVGSNVYFDFSGSAVDADGVYDITYAEQNYNGSWIEIPPSKPNDRKLTELAWPTASGLVVPSAYYLIGEKFYVTPQINSNFTLRLEYVPNLPVLAADSTALLGGKLTTFHALVGYEAALVMCAKDESMKQGSMITKLRDEVQRQLLSFITNRPKHRGSQISFRPYY